MWRLALLAVVLLAVMPTVGRLWSATRAPADMSGPMNHAMAGMAMPAMTGTHGNGGSHPAHPAPGCGEHDDCAYCSLLNTMTGVCLATVLVLPQPPPLHPVPHYRAPRIAALHPCGLGSRGPPPSA